MDHSSDRVIWFQLGKKNPSLSELCFGVKVVALSKFWNFQLPIRLRRLAIGLGVPVAHSWDSHLPVWLVGSNGVLVGNSQYGMCCWLITTPILICLFVWFPFMKLTSVVNVYWHDWIEINYSERWITRLANRWRAQQSAITIVNCRIYWAAITWTQIAVSGIPGTTFAWGSTNQHFMCKISIIVYMIGENWVCDISSRNIAALSWFVLFKDYQQFNDNWPFMSKVALKLFNNSKLRPQTSETARWI